MYETSVDNDFINQVIETYSDMVIRIAYQNTGNKCDAEDIAQEVFVKLMHANAFDNDDHRKAWLIRVTINLCKDLKKSAWHRKTQALSEEWPTVTGEQRDVINELWKLPKHHRTVVYLYYYEKYTVPEIAEMLHENQNTVSSWLTRARKKLKILLLEGGYRNE